MSKIRCTLNEKNEIVKNVINAYLNDKVTAEEYNDMEFDIIPLNLDRFTALHEDTKKYIQSIADKETTDRNGNYMIRGFIGDNMGLWYRDKEMLHCNYAPYGFYYSGFGFNDNEMLIYTWCEGDTTVTLFTDRETYQRERAETEKWFEENT